MHGGNSIPSLAIATQGRYSCRWIVIRMRLVGVGWNFDVARGRIPQAGFIRTMSHRSPWVILKPGPLAMYADIPIDNEIHFSPTARPPLLGQG